MIPQHLLLSEFLMKFDEKTKGFNPLLKNNSMLNSIIIENRIVINFEQI